MTKTIENLFQFLHLSVDVLVILLFFFFIRKAKKELPLILITAYSSLDLLLNFVSGRFDSDWYSYTWSTFTLVEYLIFTYIISFNLKNKTMKRIILCISAIFVIATTTFNITTNFQRIDSIPIGFEIILI